MPFDGFDHRGARLIPPYPHHPGSIATGGGLSSALAGSYMVSRYHATNIGIQNYYVGSFIEPTSFIEIARWRRYFPEAATHVIVEAQYLFRDIAEEGTVSHRVTVTVGGASDVGATVTDEIDPDLIIENSDGFSSARALVPPPQKSQCFVELSSVSSALPSQATVISVEAKRTSAGGYYFPILVSSWWVSLG